MASSSASIIRIALVLLGGGMVARAPCAERAAGNPDAGVAQTVGQLLKLDNALAMERMREKLPAPVVATPAQALQRPPHTTESTAQLEVVAILGVAGAQRADIVLNGRLYRLLTVGREVERWRVGAIDSGCVRLVAVDAAKAADIRQCFADASAAGLGMRGSAPLRPTVDAQPLPLPLPNPAPTRPGVATP